VNNAADRKVWFSKISVLVEISKIHFAATLPSLKHSRAFSFLFREKSRTSMSNH
jgi:hypothetical protein